MPETQLKSIAKESVLQAVLAGGIKTPAGAIRLAMTCRAFNVVRRGTQEVLGRCLLIGIDNSGRFNLARFQIFEGQDWHESNLRIPGWRARRWIQNNVKRQIREPFEIRPVAIDPTR
jgi:hypothetical protein